MVFRIAFQVLRSESAARDVAQQAFVSLLRHLSEGHEVEHPAAWLRRVATNHALDEHRRRARWRWVPFGLAEPKVSPVFEGSRDLVRALERLPPKQMAAIVLVDLEGLSSAEAAEALACTVGALEQLLHRGRTTLRKELAHAER